MGLLWTRELDSNTLRRQFNSVRDCVAQNLLFRRELLVLWLLFNYIFPLHLVASLSIFGNRVNSCVRHIVKIVGLLSAKSRHQRLSFQSSAMFPHYEYSRIALGCAKWIDSSLIRERRRLAMIQRAKLVAKANEFFQSSDGKMPPLTLSQKRGCTSSSKITPRPLSKLYLSD